CHPGSVYPWDIVIVKEDDKLHMDKQEGGPFDFFFESLSLNATFVNQNSGL
ncbi:hypothetical protein PPACK8108_LOCUS16395, partial [Phakopsora pachyrhizi]